MLADTNHRSLPKYEVEVLRKAVFDVALIRSPVFKAGEAERTGGLRISALSVVEEKEKTCVTHELTFGGPRSGVDGKRCPG